MTKFNIYLNFAGKAEEAFNFYRSVFGGEFGSLVRFKDMPMPGVSIPKRDENKLMHVSLVEKDDFLMASDVLASLGHHLIKGNNVHIMVQPDSKAEADRIFKALSEGGKVEMPLGNQVWGDYYGGLRDKFGVEWMVNYAYPKER